MNCLYTRLNLKRVFVIIISIVCTTKPFVNRAQILGGLNPTKKAKVFPKTYIGVKFGGNFSYLSGSTWGNGVKSNLVGGAFAGFKGMGFGMQAEGLFEQSEYSTGSGFFEAYKGQFNSLKDSAIKGSFRVNKLSLSLLIQFRVARLLWIQTGAQFYGIVSVRDFNNLVKDSKALFKSGGIAGILGTTMHLGNADIGARALFDFQNINKQNPTDVWKQYILQLHVGVKLF